MAEAGNSARALAAALHKDRPVRLRTRPPSVLDRAVPMCHNSHSTSATRCSLPRPASAEDQPQGERPSLNGMTRGGVHRAGGPVLVPLPTAGTLSQGARG